MKSKKIEKQNQRALIIKFDWYDHLSVALEIRFWFVHEFEPFIIAYNSEVSNEERTKA